MLAFFQPVIIKNNIINVFTFKIHVMIVYQCFGLLLAGACPNYIDDALYSLLCCTVMFSDLSKVTERSLSEVLNIKLCNF